MEHLNSLMLEATEKYKPAVWKAARPAQPVCERVGHPGPPWVFLKEVKHDGIAYFIKGSPLSEGKFS